MFYFILEEVVITSSFSDYLLFPEFLKINKNILLSFKFEKSSRFRKQYRRKHNSENNYQY